MQVTLYTYIYILYNSTYTPAWKHQQQDMPKEICIRSQHLYGLFSTLCYAIPNEWLAFHSAFFEYPPKWYTDSCIRLLHGLCHGKLLPSRRTLCVHHTIMPQLLLSHWCVCVCVFWGVGGGERLGEKGGSEGCVTVCVGVGVRVCACEDAGGRGG